MPDVAGTRDYATMKSLVYSGAIMRRFGPVFRSVQDFPDINVTVTKVRNTSDIALARTIRPNARSMSKPRLITLARPIFENRLMSCMVAP